jgi:spoIIIJ-associated protein
MYTDALMTTVTELCTQLGLSIEQIAVTGGARTVVAVKLDESDALMLLGQEGEPLRALNTLAHRLLERTYKDETPAFLVDVNGFHEQQLEKIRASVRIAAQRARLFKNTVELEPMNAYERLVIHEMFATDPEIETRSEGEGKSRHIVLTYRQ